MPPTARVYLFRTITTVRPQYFSSTFSAHNEYYDNLLEVDVSNVDIGAIFWERTFQKSELIRWAQLDQEREPAKAEFALAAINALDEARALLGRTSLRLPKAADLLFCYRVILECARIASAGQRGYKVHIARGLVAEECDQRDLSSILAIANKLHESAIGALFQELLSAVPFPASGPEVAVINLRNDGELYQAIALAAWIKSRSPCTAVVLDAAGGNEQYNFGEWIPAFHRHAEALSRYLDYFLPRQDYHASLKALVQCLVEKRDQRTLDSRNILTIGRADDERKALISATATIEEAFSHYVQTLPVFYAAGRRTILTRLSPDKCHWAACKFCTINTQHLMPRGRSQVDSEVEKHISQLIEIIRTKRLDSVVLTDEALHPNILVAVARGLLAADVRILIRARARFTNDLTLEACRLLYRAGVRFLGLGLESASQRINALFEKHLGQAINYERVLANLDAAGINAHIYAILGFPSETKAEIASTRDLLLNAIRNHRYVTVSANTFYLMRGSRAAQEPESVGIASVHERGDVGLVLGFEEPDADGKAAFAERCANEIFEAEFMPDGDEPYMARGYWSFIDQSGVFYTEKVEYGVNPYRAMAESRSYPLSDGFVDCKYVPARLFRMHSLDTNGQLGFADWSSGRYVVIPTYLATLIQEYARDQSLRTNVEALVDADNWRAAFAYFPSLYRHGFFHKATAVPGLEGLSQQNTNLARV